MPGLVRPSLSRSGSRRSERVATPVPCTLKRGRLCRRYKLVFLHALLLPALVLHCSSAGYAVSELVLPVSSGRITSDFGMRADPVHGRKAFHAGIDIASYPGAPIRSIASGRVSFTGRHPTYGTLIAVGTGRGTSVLYAHCWNATVAAGEYVEKGRVIGFVGESGRATGPHLHLEVRVHGRPINPLTVFALHPVR